MCLCRCVDNPLYDDGEVQAEAPAYSVITDFFSEPEVFDRKTLLENPLYETHNLVVTEDIYQDASAVRESEYFDVAPVSVFDLDQINYAADDEAPLTRQSTDFDFTYEARGGVAWEYLTVTDEEEPEVEAETEVVADESTVGDYDEEDEEVNADLDFGFGFDQEDLVPVPGTTVRPMYMDADIFYR